MPPWATGRRQNEKPNEPDTIDYMMEVTERMGNAIKETHGKVYKVVYSFRMNIVSNKIQVGQSRDVVGYAAGGTTEDYAYDPVDGLGVKLGILI